MLDTVPGPILKPGEQTSEFREMQATGWWAKILMVVGVVLGVVPPIIEALRSVPGAEGNKALTIVISILGIVLAVAGAIAKATTASAYITGRSVIKAAALRDAPNAPPQV